MDELVKVRCIRHVYPDKTEVGICGLDFIVNKGERVAVLGPNGAGKTTLLSHILGLLEPIEGEITVAGMNPKKDFRKLRKEIGVVFQNVDEQIIGPTVYDDIAFSLRNEGRDKEEIDKCVKNVCMELGICELLNKVPHYLSGGQKKKVALAGAMVTNPQLLVLDEPFDGLDPGAKREIMNLLNKLNRSFGTTTLVTTHDINVVPEIADVIYVLNRGHIVARGTPAEIFSMTETIREANLEPPVVVELFRRLNKRGITLPVPSGIEEAEELLLEIVNFQKKNTGTI